MNVTHFLDRAEHFVERSLIIREIRRLRESHALNRQVQYFYFAQIGAQRTILPQEKTVATHGVFLPNEVSAQQIALPRMPHHEPFELVHDFLLTAKLGIRFPDGKQPLQIASQDSLKLQSGFLLWRFLCSRYRNSLDELFHNFAAGQALLSQRFRVASAPGRNSFRPRNLSHAWHQVKWMGGIGQISSQSNRRAGSGIVWNT